MDDGNRDAPIVVALVRATGRNLADDGAILFPGANGGNIN